MTERTCTIPNCESPVKGRELCNKHLIRLRKHGDPLAYFPNKTHVCTIDSCGKPHHARGWCVMHWNRWQKHSDPLALLPHVNPIMVGLDNPKWLGVEVGYSGAHLRMWRDEPAAKHQCAHCLGAADNWAYDHEDPDERESKRGPYSIDPKHYFPLCYSCHTKFDKGHQEVRH